MMMKRLMENDLLSNFQERWFATGSTMLHFYFMALEETEIYADEISEFLLGEMDETFNCSLEDGSDKEVRTGFLRSLFRSQSCSFNSTHQARWVICPW